MSIIEKAEEIYKTTCYAIGTTVEGEEIRLRLFKSSDGRICYFRKNSKKYGHPINSETFTEIIPVPPSKKL